MFIEKEKYMLCVGEYGSTERNRYSWPAPSSSMIAGARLRTQERFLEQFPTGVERN